MITAEIDDYLHLSPLELPATRPEVVVGRYKLLAKIGSGAFGVVFRARDLITGAEVALKLLREGGGAHLRREVVALRGLKLPGVTRLLDDGVTASGTPFLVTELLGGKPFPGGPVRLSWSALAPTAVDFLTVLGRIHHIGVVHLDLKPSNVLVDASGASVLLDFGLAAHASPDHGTQVLRGTPRYMAPEQRIGGDVDERADVYTAAVMIVESFVAEPPQAGAEPHAFLREAVACDTRLSGRIRRGLLAMLEPCRGLRPNNAWEALDRLGLLPATPQPQALTTDLSSWEKVFSGPKRLFDVPARAAAHLRAVSTDHMAATHAIQLWLRLGLAHEDHGQIVLSPASLDALTSHRLDDVGMGATASSSEEEAVLLLDAGHAERAGQLLVLALSHARSSSDIASERRLLPLLVRAALERRQPSLIDMVLYEVGRAHPFVDAMVAWEELLRAAQLIERGHAERARVMLTRLAPLEPSALERWRYFLLIRLASFEAADAGARLLTEAREWADAAMAADPHSEARTHLLAILGRAHYQAGNFGEAAEHYLRMAVAANSRTVELAGLLDAASALMEVAQYVRVKELAKRVLRGATERRLPVYVARAEWLLRSVAYRSEHTTTIDMDLVNACRYLETPYIEGLIQLNEAAVAWRLGEYATGRDLATGAEKCFLRAGLVAGVRLAGALIVAQSEISQAARVERLIEATYTHPVADVDWQVLAVVSDAVASHELRQRARKMASGASDPERRREILAPIEVVLERRGAPI